MWWWGSKGGGDGEGVEVEVVMGERVMVRETRWCSGDEVVQVIVEVKWRCGRGVYKYGVLAGGGGGDDVGGGEKRIEVMTGGRGGG